jgi:ApbE superfamily uncharacterized protein (UPF0280 family)
MGIADAVTVLAASASAADAAATVIANDVDLPGHEAITRVPASEIQPDNDLGACAVTRAVGALRKREVDRALSQGCRTAQTLLAKGLIVAAALHLKGDTRIVGAHRVRESTATRMVVHA